MSRLLLIVVAVLCLQWSLADVVPETRADTAYTLGKSAK